MSHKTAFLLGVTVCVGLGCTSQAWAGWPNSGYSYPYIHGYQHTDRRIPYFAEHPPVYYSHPVARPYGYSPYAYLPPIMTIQPAEPLTITNPHFQPKAKSEKTKRRVARKKRVPTPLVVLNPYVESSSLLADADN